MNQLTIYMGEQIETAAIVSQLHPVLPDKKRNVNNNKKKVSRNEQAHYLHGWPEENSMYSQHWNEFLKYTKSFKMSLCKVRLNTQIRVKSFCLSVYVHILFLCSCLRGLFVRCSIKYIFIWPLAWTWE